MLAATLLLASAMCAADPTAGLKVPDGFIVTQFAGPELANDIHCLHIDTAGRVLVAGRGYVRYLPDTNGDGKADEAVDVIPPPPDGPMGLLWEGDTLFVTSDGGVKRFRKVDGKGPTKEKPELVLKLKTGGEHDAHAVKRGPDGKLWVLGGNMAGVTAKTISAKDSPVKEPVAGCLLRLNDDGSEVEVIADGFRNPYDFDFDHRGTPYTFDSDNERCVGLPWYEPTRVYRVLAGGNYGWLNPQHAQTWRKPPYFADVVPPLVTAGRGSPTGVAYYRHTQFPKPYRGGFFYADWTFGKIWYTHPADGKPTATAFLESTGDTGFAPTGLAVHPKTGDLYVSVGGRGTRGAVYRITWTKGDSGEPIPFIPAALPKWEPPPLPTAEDWTNAKTAVDKLRVVRGWQRAAGDLVDPKLIGTVWEGYSLRRPVEKADIADMVKVARASFPDPNADVSRELSRFLAAVEDDDADLIDRMTEYVPNRIDPIEWVHYLIVLGRLKGKRSEAGTSLIAGYLVHLDILHEQLGLARDRHWPLRLTEVATALCEKDPRLLNAVVTHSWFGHPEHLWLARLPGVDRVAAAKAFVATAAKVKNYEWSAGHAEFVAELPEATRRPLLLTLADRGFADAVAVLLAKQPTEQDRERYVAGLSAASANVVAACAKALAKLPTRDTAELAPLIRSLRRFADPKADAAVRKEVLALLKLRTGQPHDDVTKWEAWLAETHPELAKKLTAGGYDAAAWKKRLSEVNWDRGDAAKGKVLFAQAQCAACHNGGTAIGPSLAGVGKRFGRDDLLTAILEPSRDIPPRYRTTRFITADEKVYEGVVIYEAPDGVILQTAADTTIRLAGKSVEAKQPGALSLMPSGLLDTFSAADLADLVAYLKGLQ
jgi:putative heme-binding domain-containing protein